MMIYLVNNIIKYIIIFLRDFLNLWIRFLVYFGVYSDGVLIILSGAVALPWESILKV